MRHPLVRRLVAHCGVAGLITGLLTGLLTVAAPAASAADITTDLGVTFDSYTADLAVGGGRVFVSATDRIIVAGTDGNLTGGVVTGLSDVRELAMNADATRLYAALTGSNEVAEIDTASLAVTRRIDLSAHPCPSTLALLGERLWVGYGCDDPGGVVGLDLSVAVPTPTAVGGEHLSAPVLAAAGDTLVVGRTGLHHADMLVYDIGGGTPELRGTIDGTKWRMDYLRDLALTSDGATLYSAADGPGRFNRYDTRTLAVTGTYGDGWDGYPSAVALGSDGAYVAAGRQYGSTDLTLYDAATGAKLFAADKPDAELLPDGVAFSGSDVFALLRSSADRLLLWRVTGVALPASTLKVTAPAREFIGSPVTVEGRLTRADGKALGLRPIAVTRRSVEGRKDPIAGVTTRKDGTFTFQDTPPEVGEVTYQVFWDGDDSYRRSDASVTVMIRHVSTLTMDGPQSGVAGTPVTLTGVLTAGDHPPVRATLTVQRSVYVDGVSGKSVTLPPVSVNDDGTYTFTDTPAVAGRYDYLAMWSGEATAGPAKATHRIMVE
ncbi:YncE family protein [Streptosporangium sp. NPDC004379]|uniref:YncE family protein n=1 Tax=Streptosporangium sp. NPDC004379 TaxID=3366189 RepID=UPI003683859B